MGHGTAVHASPPARVGVLGGFADGVLEGAVQRILRQNQTVLRLGSIRRFELQRSLWRLYLGCRRVDRKSTRLNSSHGYISYAVFCLKKKTMTQPDPS